MWAESTLTLAFRGLLVFHRVETPDGKSWFDIGFLYYKKVPHHYPRINTIKNCVLDRIFDLRGHIRPRYRFWQLIVDNPIGGGVSISTSGPFHRQGYPNEYDFQWVMDLEGEEFYKRDLTNELNTRPLIPILRVPHGVFYTRLKSHELLRSEDERSPKPFGCVAAVIGCDIPLLGSGAKLVEKGTGRLIFEFKAGPNIIYEFANTPPDGDPHGLIMPFVEKENKELSAGQQEEETPDFTADLSIEQSNLQDFSQTDDQADVTHHGEGEMEVPEHDHFRYYYKLFVDPNFKPKYSFEPVPSGAPAPYPALCGAVRLSKRTEPLT